MPGPGLASGVHISWLNSSSSSFSSSAQGTGMRARSRSEMGGSHLVQVPSHQDNSEHLECLSPQHMAGSLAQSGAQ